MALAGERGAETATSSSKIHTQSPKPFFVEKRKKKRKE